MTGYLTVITKSGDMVRYLSAGDGDEYIVFIHGNLASSIWWKETLSRLKPGFKAYALDLPGSGETPETGHTHTMEYMAAFVAEFIEALGIRPVHLVGHSMGGGTAQLVAINYPDMVKKLVLVDTLPMHGFPELTGLGDEWFRTLMSDKMMIRMGMKAIMPHLNDDFYFEQIVDHAASSSRQVFFENPKAMSSANWSMKIGSIVAPVLFVHGLEDTLIPVNTVLMTAQAIKGSSFTYVDNCGHCPMIEVPDRFNEILFNFLANGRTS
ncbi:MAG: alpha/beta hydrolase [Nitrospirae bacterium]|nr:alpha/beta hydrolase [Nitrospirota bacterium]